MKTSSAKQKGRKLQQLVRDKLITTINESGLKIGDLPLTLLDVRSIGMGQSGRDIQLSQYAETKIPFDIECKNQEHFNIWKSLEQAESNSKDDRIPLVVFKRNRSEVYCALRLDDLLRLKWN